MFNVNHSHQSPSLIATAVTTTITVTSIIVLLSNFYQSLPPESIANSGFSILLSASMWRDAGVKMHEEDVDIVVEEEQDIKLAEEASRQREALYRIIIPTTSPHGVPSLVKSLDAAVLFLKVARSIDTRLQNIPEIDDFFEYLMQVEQDMVRIAKQGFGNIKVLIIEGLLSSGKSTLMSGLKSITQASTIEGVPANLLEVKYLFNSAEVPEAVITALDCVINYCIAHKVILDAQSKPEGHVVIIEQFYHATCALSVCSDVRLGVDLKALPSSAFEWPLDLPIPHLVIFLTVKTKMRLLRQNIGRGSCLTERSSSRNVTRDLRSQTAYSMVTGPHTIALDASQGPEEVLGAALEAMEEFGLFTPPVLKGMNKRVSIGMYGAFLV